MTPEEARLHLDACTLRPGDADAEARALSGGDPQLQAWVEKRAATDEKMADAFHAAPVPSGLNDRLLAAMMAEVQAGEAPAAAAPLEKEKGAPVASMSWLALAAAFTLSALGLWWVLQQPPAWQGEALAIAKGLSAGTIALDQTSPEYAQLVAALQPTGAPTPAGLPTDLTALSTLGCKVIKIDGQPASVICFMLAPGKPAHLITFQTQGVSGAPRNETPLYAVNGDWHLASWRAGDRAYFLATQADEAKLKALFAWMDSLSWVKHLA